MLTLSDAFPQKECTNMQTLNIASGSDRPSALFSSLRDNKENANVSELFELKGIESFHTNYQLCTLRQNIESKV